MKKLIANLQVTSPTSSAPSEETVNETVANQELAKIIPSRHQEIHDRDYISLYLFIILVEIRDYDGTTNVEAFLSQCRKVNMQMRNDAEKINYWPNGKRRSYTSGREKIKRWSGRICGSNAACFRKNQKRLFSIVRRK